MFICSVHECVWEWVTGICVWNSADLAIVHKAKHSNNKKSKIMTQDVAQK